MRRTLLVGMNNPYSDDPRLALWPDPPNCTGWRMWRMLEARTGASQRDYVRAFDRVNLCGRGRWHHGDAVIRWQGMVDQITSSYDTVVLLGAAVRRAAGVQLPQLYVSRALVCIPHPSGLNRWYNDDINRQIVEVLLEELYVEAVSE